MQRVACFFFYCLLLLCVHAQPANKNANSPTATKKPRPATPAAPAKAMLSDDIVAVFRQVQSSGLAGAKGEFESTVQYQARLASWKEKRATKKYVFVFEKDEGNYNFEYDADAEEMHLTVGKEYLVSDTIQLRSIRTALGTYVGTNAYGVKKTVTRVVESNYYVRLSSPSPFTLFIKNKYGTYEPAKFAWTMEPTTARANKAYLRIAVVGTVPSPEATEEEGVREATISVPLERLLYSRTLPFSLEEVRVLNSRTGATAVSFRSVQEVIPAPHLNADARDVAPVSLPAPPSPPQVEQAPKPAVPQRINVGQSVQNAKLIRNAMPIEPPLAKQAGINGTVRLNAIISIDGKIQDLQVSSGHPLLIAAALEAVRQWVYEPTMLSGEPVEVVTQIDVNFTGAPASGGIDYKLGNGVSAPVPLYRPDPEYSEEARKAKFQGTVLLYAEIDEQGHTRNIRVVRPLGLGLDEKAIEAVSKWRFKPGLKGGSPVAVGTTIEVSFRY